MLVGNEAYIIGGFDANGVASAKVEVYNTTSDTWRTASPLPVALHHAGAAVVNGRIFVVGGYLEGWIPTGAVWVYDPKADRWSPGTSMPTKRAALAVQAINGRVFAIGGAGEASVFSTNEVYDPLSGKWTDGPRCRPLDSTSLRQWWRASSTRLGEESADLRQT